MANPSGVSGIEGVDWAQPPPGWDAPAWKDDPSFHVTPTPTPAPNQWQYNPSTGTYSAGGVNYDSRVYGPFLSQGTPVNQPTTEAQFAQWYGDISKSAQDLANYVGSSAGQAARLFNSPVYASYNTPTYSTGSAPSVNSVPSNYTGYRNGNAYVNGTVQTGGGGFTPDGSYSAGYHGSGGSGGNTPWIDNVDHGPWGNGPNMGPTVNGTVQTGGGGFTPDGSYSAGYHGSGEHPEITGNTLPGVYSRTFYGGLMRDPFGSLLSPDVSNTARAGDVLAYLKLMGYNTAANGIDWNEPANRQKIVDQYKSGGEKFDTVNFLRTLDNGAYNPKTEILSYLAQNPNMPTSQMYNVVGGVNYSNLGDALFSSHGSGGYAPGANLFGNGQPYAWTPGNAFGRGGAGSIGNNPTGPYPGWTGGNYQPIGSIKPPPDFSTPAVQVKTLTDIPQAISNDLLINPYGGYYGNDTLSNHSLFRGV